MGLFGDSRELKNIKNENEHQKKVITWLEDENQSIKRENGNLNSENLRLKEQNLTAREELSKSFSEIQGLKGSIERLKDNNESLKREVVNLRDENESLKRENCSLNRKYLQLKEQNQHTLNPDEILSREPKNPIDVIESDTEISCEPVTTIIQQNPLNYPTDGVYPEWDRVIRKKLMCLQELYPGCADNLKLCVAPPNYRGVRDDWLACAVKDECKIVLNQNDWSSPYKLNFTMAEDTITHEFGHFVYWALNDSDKQKWGVIWDDYKKYSHETDPGYDSLYALKNLDEGFAEAFTAVESPRIDLDGPYTTVPPNLFNRLYTGGLDLVQKYRSQAFN